MISAHHITDDFMSNVKIRNNQVVSLLKIVNFHHCRCENSSFRSCIERLEGDRLCQGLDMRSFLMLPMQRVTRYPLLLIAVLEHTQQHTKNYQTAQIALHLANHVCFFEQRIKKLLSPNTVEKNSSCSNTMRPHNVVKQN